MTIQDKIFVSGSKKNIPCEIVSVILSSLEPQPKVIKHEEMIAVGLGFVAVSYDLNGVEQRQLIPYKFNAFKSGNGHEVHFTIFREEDAPIDTACCPSEILSIVTPVASVWRHACRRFNESFSALGKLGKNKVLHVPLSINPDTGECIVFYRGGGLYTTIPKDGEKPRTFVRTRFQMACLWGYVIPTMKMVAAPDNMKTRNALRLGEHLVSAVADDHGAHEYFGLASEHLEPRTPSKVNLLPDRPFFG